MNPQQLQTMRELTHGSVELLREALDGEADDVSNLPEEVVDPGYLTEGAKRVIGVNAFERSASARSRCIRHYGCRCQGCGLALSERYGEVAEGLIHVHHLVPLSEIGEEYVVDPIRDLRPVCPNCHAVVHLQDPPYAIEELQRFLRQPRRPR